MEYPRLDEWLVENGHYASRARARDAIRRGCVSVEGVAAKPSRSVVAPDSVRIHDPAQTRVSRAALKLEKALEQSGISPEGKIALDLGASTGGFCQVLLERGAARVFAVDVGHGQLDPSIAANPAVENLEGLNARDLTTDHLSGAQPELITCDLSFISLTLALPPSLALAAPGADGIFLVKPQFEVGRSLIGKGGIVRDHDAAKRKAEELYFWLGNQPDWQSVGLMPSPISGGDGNAEFLLTGKKDG